MSNEHSGPATVLFTPEEQQSIRDRLKAAFSNPTEEQRRFQKSIEEVGKRAFMKIVARIRGTIWAIEDGLGCADSSPDWLSPMREFLEQVHHTNEALSLLPPESILQEPRQKPPRDTATTQSHDTALELQNAFQRHLGEPFDQHMALDHYEADTMEERSRMVLVKAVNRVIASIAAIEERLDCENSNPLWASLMRDFLEQTQRASREIEMTPQQPAIQGPRCGG